MLDYKLIIFKSYLCFCNPYFSVLEPHGNIERWSVTNKFRNDCLRLYIKLSSVDNMKKLKFSWRYERY